MMGELMIDIPQGDYLSRTEAAAALKVSVVTLDRWAKSGKGPPVTRIAGKPLYNRAALAKWIADQQPVNRGER